ncbi:MAG TPA: hypothetical protein VI461_13900, partial [Chitinophagaceae bacterium]|nr:hypothetical protein [Chitinophagaceae bacterium]
MASVITHPATRYPAPEGMEIRAPFKASYKAILSAEALHFIRALHLRFNPHRKNLLKERETVQQKIDSGWRPCFIPETTMIRDSQWLISPVPDDIKDRRVEITGPVDRKMIINAMNSGASIFMADFEDSNSPGWDNIIGGQINL